MVSYSMNNDLWLTWSISCICTDVSLVNCIYMKKYIYVSFVSRGDANVVKVRYVAIISAISVFRLVTY